jgi:hypothetical protein
VVGWIDNLFTPKQQYVTKVWCNFVV